MIRGDGSTDGTGSPDGQAGTASHGDGLCPVVSGTGRKKWVLRYQVGDVRKKKVSAPKPIPTFSEIAKLVIEDPQSKSVNAKVRYRWERHLGPVYSGPLRDRPVREIKVREAARRAAGVRKSSLRSGVYRRLDALTRRRKLVDPWRGWRERRGIQTDRVREPWTLAS